MEKKTREEVFFEIEKNHNTSWITEVFKRNQDRLSTTAITYRGSRISYAEFFKNVEKYAKALSENGIKKGSNFCISVPNTPEYVYLLGAASALGAVITIVSPEFDKEYLKQIIGKTDFDGVFVSDDRFSEMKDVILESNKKAIVVPLNNSLKNGNPYSEITDRYLKVDQEKLNREVEDFKQKGELTYINTFLEDSYNYKGDFKYEDVDMKDPFTITFSSGSTNSTRPKAIMHNSRSYIYMGRYHDQDVSDYPTMKGATTLACIPNHSNTNINNCVSDTLMEGGTIALEPIYNEDYFLYSLIINKPTLALGTRSHWMHAYKKYYYEFENFKNVKFPFMLVPVSVGEPLAANEEKVLNKWLKKTRTGIDYVKSPTSFITMSVGGGDCEHGGIFFVLFRALQSKLPRKNIGQEPVGMLKYNMVDCVALRKDGTICAPYEPGELVCDSPCTMIGYVDNEEGNKNFYVTDANGKTWTRLNTYGYTDGKKHVYVKGRIPDKYEDVPLYIINDVILKDTKRIMSCEVVKINDENNEECYVAHVEPMFNKPVNKAKVIESIYSRCKKLLGPEIANKLHIRWHSNEEGYALTGCGKRNNKALIAEGLTRSEHRMLEFKNTKKQIKKLI